MAQWSVRFSPMHNLNLPASESKFLILALEAQSRTVNFPWSHQKSSTKRTAKAARPVCLTREECHFLQACWHHIIHVFILQNVSLPTIRAAPTCAKAIINTYCPSKEETQISAPSSHSGLIHPFVVTVISQSSLFSCMRVQGNQVAGTGRTCFLINVQEAGDGRNWGNNK